MKAIVLALVLAGCGPTLVYSGHTPDRAHRVEVMKQGDAQFVIVDGVRTGGYRGVAVNSLTFSANSAHVAFAARRGDRWIVATNDRAGEAYAYDGIGEIVVADDGRVAYAAERAGRWSVVLDGHPGPAFDAILATTLQLDHHHLVYVARSGHDVHAVIDNVPGAAFDGIGQLVVGDHVAYAGRRGARAIAVVDQTESPPCAAIAHLTVAGGRVAYAAFDDTAWRVVVDGEPGPAVTGVHAIVLDAAHVAYLARAEDHEIVVIDGTPIAASDHERSLVLTSRGLSYVESTDDGEHLVLDGQPGASYDEVGVPTFAGDRVAYAARRDRDWFVVIDGTETRIGSFASAPVFSHDGKHVGFTGRDAHGRFAMIDSRRVRFDLVVDDTFAFARDGRAWSVIAGDLEREQMFFATDRIPGISIERVPLATKELYSAAAKRDSLGLLASPDDTLVRWSEAEATRRAR